MSELATITASLQAYTPSTNLYQVKQQRQKLEALLNAMFGYDDRLMTLQGLISKHLVESEGSSIALSKRAADCRTQVVQIRGLIDTHLRAAGENLLLLTHAETLEELRLRQTQLANELGELVIPPSTQSDVSSEYNLMNQQLQRLETSNAEIANNVRSLSIAVDSLSLHTGALDVIQSEITDACNASLKAINEANHELEQKRGLLAIADDQQLLNELARRLKQQLVLRSDQLGACDQSIDTFSSLFKHQSKTSRILIALDQIRADVDDITAEQHILDDRAAVFATDFPDARLERIAVPVDRAQLQRNLADVLVFARSVEDRLQARFKSTKLQLELEDYAGMLSRREQEFNELTTKIPNTVQPTRHLKTIAHLREGCTDLRLIETELEDLLADIDVKHDTYAALETQLSVVVDRRECLTHAIAICERDLIVRRDTTDKLRRRQAVASELRRIQSRIADDPSSTISFDRSSLTTRIRLLEARHVRLRELESEVTSFTSIRDVAPEPQAMNLKAVLVETKRMLKEDRLLTELCRGCTDLCADSASLQTRLKQHQRAGRKLLTWTLAAFDLKRGRHDFEHWIYDVEQECQQANDLLQRLRELCTTTDISPIKSRMERAGSQLQHEQDDLHILREQAAEHVEKLCEMHDAMAEVEQIRLDFEANVSLYDHSSPLNDQRDVQRAIVQQDRLLDHVRMLMSQLDDLDIEIDEGCIGMEAELAVALSALGKQLDDAQEEILIHLHQLRATLQMSHFVSELDDLGLWLGEQERHMASLERRMHTAQDEEADELVIAKLKIASASIKALQSQFEELTSRASSLVDNRFRSKNVSMATMLSLCKSLTDRYLALNSQEQMLTRSAESNKRIHQLLWDIETLQHTVNRRGLVLDIKAGRKALALHIRLVQADIPSYDSAVTDLEERAFKITQLTPSQSHAVTMRTSLLRPSLSMLVDQVVSSELLLLEMTTLNDLETKQSTYTRRIDEMRQQLDAGTKPLLDYKGHLAAATTTTLLRQATDAVVMTRREMFALVQHRQHLQRSIRDFVNGVEKLPAALVQSVLEGLAQCDLKQVHEYVNAVERKVVQAGRLIETEREVARLEHWMARQSSILRIEDFTDQAAIENLLQQMTSFDALLQLQDARVGQLVAKV
eukprot:TRINITY_DN7035_c0_g1_i1.p1 TRINITY_DN7035_c0_g1~~TRINITY_DN7035_c0_g1_i1.p1  ORF type:complete len:1251 (+),score=216.49 TRINITY_DN7035_c0_g1_i1:341-3754(+)